jgi:hypothetical protein
MMQKVAFGSICSGFALSIALWSNHKIVQAAAVAAGSCFASFTATTIAIEQDRLRKSRAAHADLYLEMLRHMNHHSLPTQPQRPKVCQGCCFYHGRVYSGNQLICAMHPYGVESDDCADWQTDAAEKPSQEE